MKAATIHPAHLPDIAGRPDLVRLVDHFYDKVRADEKLGNVIYNRIHRVPDPRFDPARLTPESKARYASHHSPEPAK